MSDQYNIGDEIPTTILPPPPPLEYIKAYEKIKFVAYDIGLPPEVEDRIITSILPPPS